MSLVLIEFFLQRQGVFHGTDSSHGSAHKHHAPRVGDGDGCIDNVKCRYLAEDLEHRGVCSVGGAELCLQGSSVIFGVGMKLMPHTCQAVSPPLSYLPSSEFLILSLFYLFFLR